MDSKVFWHPPASVYLLLQWRRVIVRTQQHRHDEAHLQFQHIRRRGKRIRNSRLASDISIFKASLSYMRFRFQTKFNSRKHSFK